MSKRKFCIVTKDFSGLGFALLNKTDKVIIARNPDMEKMKEDPEEYEKYLNIGKGLVDVYDLSDVMERRDKMKGWYFVFDGNHSVDENELLRKEGFNVCLGGELSYKMENDREYGIQLAEKLGIKSPEWKDFKSADEGIAFLEQNEDKAYVFKPNGADESYLTTVPHSKDPHKANENLRTFIKNMGIDDFILQEKVKGVEVNLEYMCQYGEVKGVTINLECKRISDGDTGAMCGCALDVCRDIPMDSELVKISIEHLKPLIEKEKFTGFADLNCIVGETDVWFIEWCWRTGYNAHPNYFMTIAGKDYLNTLADLHDSDYKHDVKRGWGASVTVYVDKPHNGIPIDVPEELQSKVFYFDGMKKGDALIETGISNELLIVGGYGYRIKDAIEDAYANIDKIDILNMDFRSDGTKDDYLSSPIRRWRCLEEMGLV